jgi:type VI secretion system secreted protein VgrG
MQTKQLTVSLVLSLICAYASADVMPFLGKAQQFAVLGAQSVTNTNATTLHGNVGVAPGSSITGTDNITFASGGVVRSAAVAMQAQANAAAAYERLAALTGAIDLSGQDLGSVGTLTPGIYRFSSSAALTGTLTLNFANDPGGIFIFQIGSTLSTAANSLVHVINGTSSNGLYFQVGSSATLGEGTAFAGNVLARQSVTFGSASSIVCGRAVALAGAVTMTGNTVSNDCNAYSPSLAGDYGSMGYSGFGIAALPQGEVPEPATLALFTLGFCTLAWHLPGRRFRIDRGTATSCPTRSQSISMLA